MIWSWRRREGDRGRRRKNKNRHRGIKDTHRNSSKVRKANSRGKTFFTAETVPYLHIVVLFISQALLDLG